MVIYWTGYSLPRWESHPKTPSCQSNVVYAAFTAVCFACFLSRLFLLLLSSRCWQPIDLILPFDILSILKRFLSCKITPSQYQTFSITYLFFFLKSSFHKNKHVSTKDRIHKEILVLHTVNLSKGKLGDCNALVPSLLVLTRTVRLGKGVCCWRAPA